MSLPFSKFTLKVCLFLLFTLVTFLAQAQLDLLKDIHQMPSPVGSGVDADNLTDVNGTLFYNGKSEKGYELWKSDGTPGGTVLVKDILPGSNSSTPQNLINVNGVLYFYADDGLHGSELWKSDGTDAGTVLVKDIQLGVVSSKLANFKTFDGDLYFTLEGENGNLHLWKSDGTAAGTYLIKSNAAFGSAVWLNGFLFFTAYADGTGFELWKTDGTAVGSSLVKDIEPGINGSTPERITLVDNTIYFAARTQLNGSELWMSDGTESGTKLVEDLVPGSGSTGPGFLTDLNGTLFFISSNGFNDHSLFMSDGTPEGTGLVTRFTNCLVSSIFRIDGTLYLAMLDMATSKQVLWKSNGTAPGTSLIKVFNPGMTNSLRSFVNSNGTLFFIAQRETVLGNDPQVWKTDGTPGGTVMVTDIPHQMFYYGTVGVYNLMGIGNTLYFVSDDDENGNEIWKIDNTELVPRLLTNTANGTYNSDTHGLTEFNGSLYFSAIDVPTGWELWKSDGTTAGTNLFWDVAAGPSSSKPSRLLSADNKLFFVTTGSNGGLWKSEGTLLGTIKFSARPAGTSEFRYVNGKLFFAKEGTPYELWQVDPVSGNAARATGPGITNVYSLTDFKNELFFVGSEGATAWLMKTDGTAAGTAKITMSNAIQKLYSTDNLLYFSANNGTNGRELWKTDGTPAGTSILTDINSGTASAIADNEPFQMQHTNTEVYFVANDGVHGFELWRTNGLAAGTSLVKDINPGAASASISNLTNVNGVLYFVADDGINGQELWKSDGTAGGTVMIMDINGGPYSASPENLLGYNGVLYFSAYDGVIRTLWKSNGKPCGTLKATSNTHVIAGGQYKEIYGFKNKIFVTGSTPETGEELYVHDTANDPPIPEACKSSQSITFNLTPSHTYGESPVSLNAVATSQLPVQYISSDPSVASVNGNTVAILKAGTVTITARQTGNQNFSAAPDVDQVFIVGKANQNISFASTRVETFGNAPFTLNATATSGLPVEYISSDPDIVSIVGNVATILKSGVVYILVRQPGNERYLAAAEISQTLTINKANQTITFQLVSQVTFGDAPFDLSASSTSGLPVYYTSSDPTVLHISGNVASILRAGIVNVTAWQDGNENFNPQNVVKPITIGKANQFITFDAIDTKKVGDGPFTLNASASSGLPLNCTSSSPDVATVNGNTVTILKAGHVTILATQAGNENYNAAPAQAQSFCIHPPKPTITVGQFSEAAATLTSSSPNDNQWYVNGNVIDGASANVLEVLQQGIYSVQVTASGCKSEFSDDIEIIVTDIEVPVLSDVVRLYPNPVVDVMVVQIPEIPGKKSISIYNSQGVVMANYNMENSFTELNVSFLSAGVYSIRIVTSKSTFTKQFVKK